jgi:hypothetical protein
MFKMGSYCTFEYLKHKLWPKERSRIKLALSLLSITKSRESTWVLNVQATCDIPLESSQWGLQLYLDLIAIGGLHTKLWAPTVARIPIVGISGFPLGSFKAKNHLDVALVERRKVYYKGEGGGFPQVRAMVSLVSLNCLWFILAPKVFQLSINHFVLVLCRFMWMIEACQLFLVPSQSSSMPFYPSKVLRARERAPTPCFSVVFNLDSHLNPSRS